MCMHVCMFFRSHFEISTIIITDINLTNWKKIQLKILAKKTGETVHYVCLYFVLEMFMVYLLFIYE